MLHKSKNKCTNCGKTIVVMAFKGTGFCCENCRGSVSPKRRKARQIDKSPKPQRSVHDYG